MKLRITPFVIALAISLASALPGAAGAAMPRAVSCDNPSWADLVSGSCGGESASPFSRHDPFGGAVVVTPLALEPIGSVPEPETYSLLLGGLVLVVVVARRARKR